MFTTLRSLVMLAVLLPSFALAYSYEVVGDYRVVVCGEERACEPMSVDFDYRGELTQLLSWIDTYDREYHADDLFLLRKLPMRQVGAYGESHPFYKSLQKYLEFEPQATFYIVSTTGQSEPTSGYEITETELAKINDYLDWYITYYYQTDDLRSDMIKAYVFLSLIVLVAGSIFGYRLYKRRHSVVQNTRL